MDVPALGDGVGEVDGDGDGVGVVRCRCCPVVQARDGRAVVEQRLQRRANDVPCATLLWSPTITSCSCGNEVPLLAAAVT